MEILQKNAHFIFHVATVTLPQQSSTLSSFPGSSSSLLGSNAKDKTKHQPVTAPENARPPCDLEMSNLGSFGPNILVSTLLDYEPVHLLPSLLLILPFMLPEARFTALHGKE